MTVRTFYNISKRQGVRGSLSHNDLSWVAVKEPRCVKTDHNFMDDMSSMYDKHIRPIWPSLSDDYILPFLGIDCREGFPPAIIVPYCAKGNIVSWNSHSDNADKKLQTMQIAGGLNYLHEQGIPHGNICPENILIRDDGGVWISDPCLNFHMRQLKYDTYNPIPASYQYKPPEELMCASQTSHEGDVYSWASVIYEVFSGKRPYHGLHSCHGVFKIVNEGHRTLDKPSEISPQLWNILLHCWALKPEDRPSMHEVEAMVSSL